MHPSARFLPSTNRTVHPEPTEVNIFSNTDGSTWLVPKSGNTTVVKCVAYYARYFGVSII